MRLQLKITGLLSKQPNLTINQIAKGLDESYSFVNRTVNRMINENLILKEKIGHSLLCKLNLGNDKTKALMLLNEVNKKQELLEKNRELKLIADELKGIKADSVAIFGSYAKNLQTKESDIDVLVVSEKQDLTTLTRNIHAKYGKEISPLILTKKELEHQKDKPIIREIIKNHVILAGFENFINVLKNET
jgi:predicted nucleotidyltransferase